MSNPVIQITINFKDKHLTTVAEKVCATRRVYASPRFGLLVRGDRVEFGNETYDLQVRERTVMQACLSLTLIAVTDQATVLTYGDDLLTLTVKGTNYE